MPEFPPEEHPEGMSQRRVTLYVDDRKTIWLDIDDVAWAIRFLYVQHWYQGVPAVSPDSTGPTSVAPFVVTEHPAGFHD